MKHTLKLSVLVLVCLSFFLIAGCGNSKQEESSAPIKDDFVYVAEYINLSTDDLSLNSSVFGKDNMIYFVGNSKTGSKLMSIKIGEESLEEITLDLEKDANITGIGVDTDGNLLVGIIKILEPISEETLEPTEEAVEEVTEEVTSEDASPLSAVEIRKVTTDGKTVESIDVSNLFSSAEYAYITSIATDKDGNYYICGSESIYVIKPTGELICEVSADTYISNMLATKDGRVLAGYYSNEGFKLEEVNLSQKGLSKIDSSIAFDYGTYQGGTDFDMIYTQGSKLYTCNLNDEKPTEILNWVDSDIDSNNLQNFRILEDGRVAAFSIDYNSDTPASELAVLTKKNRSEIPEKKVLTYATTYLAYSNNKDIVAFNKQSDEYRIEVKQYAEDGADYDTIRDLMIADISSGKGPDIIDLLFTPISFEEAVTMGIFEDLNSYLDKDENLKREDFVENAMKTYERDGKLYSIMPCFGVNTIVGKVSDVGTGSSWTLDEINELVEARPEVEQIYSNNTKNSVVRRICAVNRDKFINPETGECNFVNEEFYKILDFANHFPKEYNYDPNEPSEYAKARNGQILLLNGQVTSVQLYQMYKEIYGEEVNFIGFPTMGDSGSFIISNGTTVGMNVNSENKEGVWEFIKFNLTTERQENLQTANSGFPILKSALEKKFEDDMEDEYYVDVDGKQTKIPKATWGSLDFTVDVWASTKDEVDAVRNLINTAGHETYVDADVFDIVEEEAQGYFEGQKTAPEVAEIIQSRIQIYVNENR